MKADTGAGLSFDRLNGGNVKVSILGALLSASLPIKEGEDRPKLGNVEVEITSDDWSRVSHAMGAHPGLEISESDKRDMLGDDYESEDNTGATVNRTSKENSRNVAPVRKKASGTRARR